MKAYLLGAVLLSVTLFGIHPTTVLAVGTNLIQNPSVETKQNNSTPVHWSHTKKGNNISQFSYANEGQEGSKSISINITKYVAGESYWYFTDTPVTAGNTYTYSAFYKSTMPTKVYLKTRTSAGVEIVTELSNLPTASVWTETSSDVTIPIGVTSIVIYHSARAVGTLQTDTFSLTEKTTVPIVIPPTPTSTPPVATTTPPVIPPTPTTTPVPPANPIGNPIPNPSVETVSSNTGTLPLYWSTTKTGNNNAVFTYGSDSHTGNKGLKITIGRYTSGIAYFAFDSAPITGGKTYDYSFYYKSDSYAEVDAAITLDTGEVVYQYLGVSYPSTEWSRFSTRIRVPENAKSVSIYNMLYSKGYLVTDDFALSQVQVIPLARPIVTLTFDDFFSSFYDTVYPMMKAYDFGGTVYLTTQDLGTPNTLTATQLNEMRAGGFEVGAHTVTHAHLPFVSSSQVDYELSQSQKDIQNFLGIKPINFATPYGEYNDTIKEHMKPYYRSHRSVDVGYNTKDNFDAYNIKAMSATNLTSPETVLGWVDDAIRDKAWLVLVYHDIVDNGPTFSNTPAHLQTVVNGIKARGVPVKTVDKALDEIIPQI